MAQSTKVIDVTRTYLPVDPQNYNPNLHGTKNEDYPEKTIPVVAYEGYNFLPTHYGYKSYFGTNASFPVPAIPARVDRVLIFEAADYTNYLVAMTEQGIYTNKGGTNEAWVQAVTLATPTAGTHRNWSWCVIANKLYMYRAEEAAYYVMNSTGAGTVTTVTPTFLTMAGQRGIFKAGGRLGFWDSMNSVAWSNLDDHADFAPSLTTLAASAIFNDVKGKITTIQSHGDGFIIYATGSIVLVNRDLSKALHWDPKLLVNSGIAYPNQVAVASPDTTHYAYTKSGLLKIEDQTTEATITEVTDLLKESLYPVALSVLENRYVMLNMMEAKFIEGMVQFEAVNIAPDPTPTGLTTATAKSTLGSAEFYRYLSEGKTAEQIALARDNLIARGYDPNTFVTGATPVWEYKIRAREPVTITNSSINYGYTVLSAKNPASPAGTYYEEFRAYGSQVVDSIAYQETGAGALYSYMNQQKARWDASVAEHKAALTTFANQTVPGAQSTAVITDPITTVFEYNACSVRGYTILGKIGWKDGAGVMRSETVAPNWNGTIAAAATGSVPPYAYNVPVADGDPGASNPEYFFQFLIESSAKIVKWNYSRTDGTSLQLDANLCPTNNRAIDPTLTDVATIPAYVDPVNPYPWTVDPIDTPSTTVTLQKGDQGPIYPTYQGSLVYDLRLKKWGKLKLPFTTLLDLSPVNTFQGKIVATQRFGIDAAAVLGTKLIHRFDSKPADSYIKYGKIGYYRQGFTHVEEVKVQFRTPCTGSIEVEASLDGRNLEAGMSASESFTDATHITYYPSLSGKWHNVTLRGNYDITYLEYRGRIAGRR